MKKIFAGFSVALAVLTFVPFASAATTDLVLTSVTVSPEPVLINKDVRLYVTVENAGQADEEAIVSVMDGESWVGSKPVSLKIGGRPDEAWILWKPTTYGSHRLTFTVVDDGVTDATPANNQVTRDIFVDRDTDGDGIPDATDPDDDNDDVPDAQDQFPLDATRSKDTDGDGIEDKVDSDQDNDGLYNYEENAMGTNPLKKDTDGDGVNDKQDAFPLDVKRSQVETASSSGGGSVVPPKPVVPTKESIELTADVAPTRSDVVAAAVSTRVATSTALEPLPIVTSTPALQTTTSISEDEEAESPSKSESKASKSSFDKRLIALPVGTLALALLFFTLSHKKEKEGKKD